MEACVSSHPTIIAVPGCRIGQRGIEGDSAGIAGSKLKDILDGFSLKGNRQS